MIYILIHTHTHTHTHTHIYIYIYQKYIKYISKMYIIRIKFEMVRNIRPTLADRLFGALN